MLDSSHLQIAPTKSEDYAFSEVDDYGFNIHQKGRVISDPAVEPCLIGTLGSNSPQSGSLIRSRSLTSSAPATTSESSASKTTMGIRIVVRVVIRAVVTIITTVVIWIWVVIGVWV